MAFAELPFLDSFAHYSSSTWQGKWTSTNGTFVMQAAAGREGGQCFGGLGNSFSIQKSFVNGYTSLYSGFAVKYDNSGEVIRFYQPSMTNSNNGTAEGHARLLLSSDNRLSVEIHVPGVTINTTHSYVVIASTWFFWELGVVLNSSGGHGVSMTVQVRVNNQLVINETLVFSTGSDGYQITSGFNFNDLQLTCFGCLVSDFYCTNSGFYGDSVVAPIYPDSPGNYTQWTPNPNTNANWQNVNEHPPDSDATYNSAGTVGLKDSYGLQDIPGAVTVKALQALWWMEKDASGVGTFQSLYRSAGADQNGQTFAPSLGSYQYFLEGNELSPFTGVAWTPAEINALELGQNRNG